MKRIALRKSDTDEPAVLIFGLVAGSARGVWLTQRDAERLVPTSLTTDCHVVPLTDGQKARVTDLPRGHILNKGRIHLPTIDRSLYDELERTFPSQPPAKADSAEAKSDLPESINAPSDTAQTTSDLKLPKSNGSDEPKPADEPVPSRASATAARLIPALVERPLDWDEIKVGSLVLAYDVASEAWYEAIVLMPHGDQWLLRWRDYPAEGTVARGRPQIALMYPSAA